jgi:hypothetical protein
MKRALAIALVAVPSVFGQCVMCFRTAAAQQAERARVMNLGIIIMLIPPVVILGGFLLLCYKRRHTYAVGEPTENLVAEPELAAMLQGGRQ